MARDAFSPGDDGSYPAFPRRLDGSPAWSDTAATDGVPVPGRGPGGVVTPMPTGTRRGPNGIVLDVTPRGPGGALIVPPTLP
jgi:hypothetical protein